MTIAYTKSAVAAGIGAFRVAVDGFAVIDYAVADADFASVFTGEAAFLGFAASTGVNAQTAAPIAADLFIYNLSVFADRPSPNTSYVSISALSAVATTTAPSTPSTTLFLRDYCNSAYTSSAGVGNVTCASSNITCAVADNTNGTFALALSGRRALDDVRVNVFVDGMNILSSPLVITIVAGAADPAHSLFTVNNATSINGALTVTAGGVVSSSSLYSMR